MASLDSHQRVIGTKVEWAPKRLLCMMQSTFHWPCAALVCAMAVVSAASAGEPSRTLHIGLVQQPNSLDPLHATQFYENYVTEATFSALTLIDDRGDTVPDLAERVPTRANGLISADGRTITYRLHAGVRWQDGVPLTSADVRYTLDRMRDPTSNFVEASFYSIIDRLDTPDARTVVLHLKSPWADATSQLFVGGQNGSILPKHILEHVANLGTSSFESAPVGSGPYALVRWERGNKLVLRANPTYFRGKPAIDRIELDFVPDQTVIGIRLKTHEIDFSPQLTQLGAEAFEHAPEFARAKAPTFTDLELVFQTARAPFDDARMRRALAIAIDRARLVDTVYHHFAEVGDDLVPSRSPFHKRDGTVREHGDLDAARRLLDAAGWRAGSDGIRRKNGNALSFPLTVPAGYADIVACAVAMQATWKSLGVDVELRPIVANQLYETVTGTLSSGKFVAALQRDGYATSPDRADSLTTSGLPPHGRNYARYANRDVDRWTAQARGTYDDARRSALYAKISARVREDAAVTPLLWVSQPYVWDARLTGLRPETVNSDFWNVREWRWR